MKGEDVIQTELLWLSYNWTKVLELTKTSTFGGLHSKVCICAGPPELGQRLPG